MGVQRHDNDEREVHHDRSKTQAETYVRMRFAPDLRVRPERLKPLPTADYGADAQWQAEAWNHREHAKVIAPERHGIPIWYEAAEPFVYGAVGGSLGVR